MPADYQVRALLYNNLNPCNFAEELYVGEKRGRFYSRNVEGFSTTGITAACTIVQEHHITLAFVEAGAIPDIRSWRQAVFLAANEPSEFELLAGPAVRTT
jgi:hypothetical protein